jgi:ribose-phosphate pyrophosphokinase
MLGKATSAFSDGEVMVELLENVRGKDVFVLQSTCMPTNDSLMEVLVMVDALKRASAGRITAAMPYFGYARQDRRPASAMRRDQRQGGRQHAAGAGVAARADDGPARRPDPGLLRHPGGQHLRRAGAAGDVWKQRTRT